MAWNDLLSYINKGLAEKQVLQKDTPINFEYMGGQVQAADDGSVFIVTITAVGCSGSFSSPSILVYRLVGNSYVLSQTITPRSPTWDDMVDNEFYWGVKAVLSGDGSTLLIPAPKSEHLCEGNTTSRCGSCEVYKDVNGTFTFIKELPMMWSALNILHPESFYALDISYDGTMFIAGEPFSVDASVNGSWGVYQDTIGDGSGFDTGGNTVLQPFYVGLNGLYAVTDADFGFNVAIPGFATAVPGGGRIPIAVSYTDSSGIGHVVVLKIKQVIVEQYNVHEYFQDITSPNPVSGDLFGSAHSGCKDDFCGKGIDFSHDGKYLLIGSPYGYAGVFVGAAYLYKLTDDESSYQLLQEFKLDNPSSGDYYGYHVSISPDSNYVAIGVQGYDGESIANVGAVDVYKKNSQGMYDRLQLLEPNIDISLSGTNTFFGYAVDIKNGILFVTATDEDQINGSAIDVGSVRVFRLSPDWSDIAAYEDL